MNSQIQFKIEEILLAHALEPEIVDIFVEGSTDVPIFEEFIEKVSSGCAVVFHIDVVDVDKTTLERFALDGGNKGRVIALALSLEEANPAIGETVVCIADKDFDHMLDGLRPSSVMLWSDFCSMDSYLFDENTVQRFMKYAGLGGRCKPANDLVPLLTSILQQVACERLAALKISPPLTWLCFLPCCRVRDGDLVYDRLEHTKRFLSRNSQLAIRDEFEGHVAAFESYICAEARDKIRGKDFLELLSWYVRQCYTAKREYTADLLRVVLWGYMDRDELYSQPLFNALRDKLEGEKASIP